MAMYPDGEPPALVPPPTLPVLETAESNGQQVTTTTLSTVDIPAVLSTSVADSDIDGVGEVVTDNVEEDVATFGKKRRLMPRRMGMTAGQGGDDWLSLHRPTRAQLEGPVSTRTTGDASGHIQKSKQPLESQVG